MWYESITFGIPSYAYIQNAEKENANIKLTFGRIEASNLDDIITFWPFQLIHLLLGTKAAEFAHVVLRIPDICVNNLQCLGVV